MQQPIICRYRDKSSNLRTQLGRITRRAGLTLSPKPFQDCRSAREPELAETVPLHVVSQWLGNRTPVAQKHYLQVTDEHFGRAAQYPAVLGICLQGHIQTKQRPKVKLCGRHAGYRSSLPQTCSLAPTGRRCVPQNRRTPVEGCPARVETVLVSETLVWYFDHVHGKPNEGSTYATERTAELTTSDGCGPAAQAPLAGQVCGSIAPYGPTGAPGLDRIGFLYGVGP
jgi:hypothetical protein